LLKYPQYLADIIFSILKLCTRWVERKLMNNLKYNKPCLKENEYHLWYTKPRDSQDLDLLDRYKVLLNEEELEKQQRYIFEKDRHDALITRAFIRDVLSQYMDVEPSDWKFTKGENGKPEIDYHSLAKLIPSSIPLRFNISHTKELIICAVTLNNDIGCDVEHIGRSSDLLAIADRYFSEVETKELFSLPEKKQRDRFFDYWTLKESYIKAWGQGLAIPLSDFSFHLGVSESKKQNSNIQLSFAEKRQDNAKHWQSWIFYPSDEHRVSVSIRQINKDSSQDSDTNYNIRFFETKPLVSYEERTEIIL
jgi:4'-phosphopantetheinyl transferase